MHAICKCNFLALLYALVTSHYEHSYAGAHPIQEGPSDGELMPNDDWKDS